MARWMPAAAQDRYGNLLLQYTVASSTVYPGIRYTGRAADDPTSTLPQGEVVLMEGSGSQTGTSRWGDYATIALDPLDDCTFWFANEYVPETGVHSWATTIAAVRFTDCVPGVTPTPAPTLTTTPTATATLVPPTEIPTEIPIPATVTVEAPEVPTQTPTFTATPVPTETAPLPSTTPTSTASLTVTSSATRVPSPTLVPVPPEPTPEAPYRLYLPVMRR